MYLANFWSVASDALPHVTSFSIVQTQTPTAGFSPSNSNTGTTYDYQKAHFIGMDDAIVKTSSVEAAAAFLDENVTQAQQLRRRISFFPTENACSWTSCAHAPVAPTVALIQDGFVNKPETMQLKPKMVIALLHFATWMQRKMDMSNADKQI